MSSLIQISNTNTNHYKYEEVPKDILEFPVIVKLFCYGLQGFFKRKIESFADTTFRYDTLYHYAPTTIVYHKSDVIQNISLSIGVSSTYYHYDESKKTALFCVKKDAWVLQEIFEKYRYGFQSQEKDDEIKGEGNSLNFTFRMHDPRLGRFLSVDPLVYKFPYFSPYSFAGNSPIAYVDAEGLENEFHMRQMEDYYTGTNMALQKQKAQQESEANYFILAAAGIGIAVLVGPEVMVAWLIEEGIEYVVEEATGIPIIVDPFDVGEFFIKRARKEASKEVIEKGGKKIPKDAVDEGTKKSTNGVMKDSPVDEINQEITWQKAEKDFEKSNPDIEHQKVFKDGVPVPNNKKIKGSTVPDGYDPINNISFDVKRYKSIEDSFSALKSNIKSQYMKRITNMPEGVHQTFVIDARGLEYNKVDMIKMQKEIIRDLTIDGSAPKLNFIVKD